MKGVYLRGRVWWLRYSSGGHQQFESLETENEAEAIERAEAILDSPGRLSARTWELELKEYLKERTAAGRLSKNSAPPRLNVLLKFGRDMGVTKPIEVTEQLTERWYRRLQGEIEEVTAQTYVGWLNTFLSYLVEKRKLRRNPMKIALDRLPKARRKQFCTSAQVLALIMAAPTAELRFVLYCGFHAGLRREEIGEARPEWFDLERGLLHLQRSETWEPKDRDDRTIPLSSEFLEFLKAYGLRAPFMLAPHKKTKRKSRYRYDFRRPFEEMMKALGVEWITPHTMRRTFASLKVSDGVSLYKVAVWLGDLERVVQDHYGFLIPNDREIDRGL